MIKLKFIPDYFPIILMPLYWIFFLCFYIIYLPIYGLVLLFSPFRSKKSLIRYYSKHFSKEKRDLNGKEEKKDE